MAGTVDRSAGHRGHRAPGVGTHRGIADELTGRRLGHHHALRREDLSAADRDVGRLGECAGVRPTPAAVWRRCLCPVVRTVRPAAGQRDSDGSDAGLDNRPPGGAGPLTHVSPFAGHSVSPNVRKNQRPAVNHRPTNAAKTRPPATGSAQAGVSRRLSISILAVNAP
jgi:hypothetical protein